jgi:hypothetical protein
MNSEEVEIDVGTTDEGIDSCQRLVKKHDSLISTTIFICMLMGIGLMVLVVLGLAGCVGYGIYESIAQSDIIPLLNTIVIILSVMVFIFFFILIFGIILIVIGRCIWLTIFFAIRTLVDGVPFTEVFADSENQ